MSEPPLSARVSSAFDMLLFQRLRATDANTWRKRARTMRNL
jgi:hypothetical protein